MNTTIKIAIVDDHTLFRKGLISLMKEFDELQVVFEAENGLQMQEYILNKKLPQVILMDINMPEMDGYEATKWLKQNYAQINILALSMLEEDEAVIGMLKCGAGGYVVKETKPADLLEAIKIIYQKGTYVNDLVSGKLLKSLASPLKQNIFTTKELEFMRLCCSELTYKEMADVMSISPRTIDNYRESLFIKLNIKSRTGIVLYAIQKQIFKI
ncbi:response regulator [Mucilaginibacter angelicae]|uniref:Response regulator n=1 Tax=Mucilaginibacter angelicae TaxID=869718 RepID=A0ABV6L6Q6_9SPHI